MPQIARKVLGQINMVDEQSVDIIQYTVAEFNKARVFNGGIIAFSPNVIEESIQISATDNLTGNVVPIQAGFGGSLSLTQRPPDEGGVGTLYRGNMCTYITDFRSTSGSFYVADCDELSRISPGINETALAFLNDCVKINNSTARWKCGDPPAPGFSALFTFLRPRTIRPLNQFGAKITNWGVYNITVLATGFELNDYVQDTGENEEIISCLVVDPNSKTLYGERPNQSEEQSDFIETQLQACRVGENIIWQQNKVIEVNFQIPFRPAIRRGQTIRVLNPAKSIEFLGIVKSFSHDFDFGGATVTTSIQATTTEYLFETASGLKNLEDKIDLRA